jgi:endonuclease/exonuclease/phosphatase (EEP) superfamily protein YafD
VQSKSHIKIRMICRAVLLVTLSALVPACTSVKHQIEGQRFDSAVVTISDPQECVAAVSAIKSVQAIGLNPRRIRILSWNLQKAQHQEALYQLGVLSSDADIVSIQEAKLNDNISEQFPNLPAWSFGPGYTTKSDVTGVMNLSKVAPLTHCVFASTEPWLRTPKATAVTEYPLRGRAATLLAINVHGVNFTFTSKSLAAQLERFSDVIENHNGPVVLSGDFNTWSNSRFVALEAFAVKHDLQLLDFDVDHRKTVFGKVLDHVLVRGIEVLDTTSYQVETSDHNALRVELRVTEGS